VSDLTKLLREQAEREKAAPKVLAEEIKPASKTASKPANLENLLAGLSVKGASKLAEEIKPASRTESQMLADARKSKGHRTQIAIRISTDLKREIDEFILKQEITQQDFFEMAASTFMSKVLAEDSAKGASKLAHNNKELIMIFKTDTLIIDCYTRIVGKKWKPHDDRAAESFNGCDVRLIELGIIQTLANAKTTAKIHSFKYCVPEIEAWIAAPVSGESVEIALAANKARLKAMGLL
jgi:hypothetical protein